MALKKSLSCRGLGLPFPGLREVADAASAAGFAAVDLPLRELWESGLNAQEVRTVMSDYGLVAGASPLPFFWRTDAQEFRRNLDSFLPVLEFAKNIGITRIYTRVSESLPDGETESAVIGRHQEFLGKIAELLEPAEILMGLETVGVESFRQGRPPLMNTLQKVRTHLSELFNQFQNIGLLIDVFHLHAADESLVQAIGPYKNRIAGVHVADLPATVQRADIIDHHRALPNTTGTVPTHKILAEIDHLGIDTSVMVETVQNVFENEPITFQEIARRVHQSLDYWDAQQRLRTR